MQQIIQKISNKFQNDTPEFSIFGAISDTSVASDLRPISSSEFWRLHNIEIVSMITASKPLTSNT
jgi:hypothetical protein